jgi:predicted Zn-dependent protease
MKTSLVIPLIILLLVTSAPAQTRFPLWQPPTPRKSVTLFAPRPFGGNNIFKGEKEAWLSDALEEEDFGTLTELKDKEIVEYISRLGVHLALHSPKPKRSYTFVVTSSTTPDALTSGSGRIYITKRMLRLVKTEDELAGILAHEIAHDIFGHIPKTLTRQLFWMTGTKKVTSPVDVRNKLERLLQEYEKKPVAKVGEQLLGFSRFDEIEADRGAFYITYKSGYNPRGLTRALERFKDEQKVELSTSGSNLGQLYLLLMGSHPPTALRSFESSLEANFVKAPSEDAVYQSHAFDEMKRRLTVSNAAQ